MDCVKNHDECFGMRWGVLDSSRKFTSISPILKGKHVVDIGCGNGTTTYRILKETGVKSLCAIEPFISDDLSILKDNNVIVHQDRLQNLVCTPVFYRKFDVATVFKFNAFLLEKREFVASLAQVIKQNGTVVITCVERERCFYNNEYAGLYIMDALNACFGSVFFKEVTHLNGYTEGLIVCTKPKL